MLHPTSYFQFIANKTLKQNICLYVYIVLSVIKAIKSAASESKLTRLCPFQILLAVDYSQCQACPEDTFNDLTGQVYCRPCGSSSYAPAGSALCTCLGKYRSFQPSYGACVCESGYIYYDETDTKKEDGNSPEDCQQVVDVRCSTSETRLASTRTCVSPGSVDCSQECAFSGSGSLDVSLGRWVLSWHRRPKCRSLGAAL